MLTQHSFKGRLFSGTGSAPVLLLPLLILLHNTRLLCAKATRSPPTP